MVKSTKTDFIRIVRNFGPYRFNNIAPKAMLHCKVLQYIFIFQALTEFISEKGYPREVYEVVTNFPRRIITDLDMNLTMKEAKLFPRETVFVQIKD